MNYIIDFCIVSLLYLSIITIFYISQPRIKSESTKLFGYLLMAGVISLILDIICAITAAPGDTIPRFILYFINIVFLAVTQIGGPLFLMYSLVVAGHYSKLSKLAKFIIFIPYTIIIVLLLLSTVSNDFIFYFNENNVYTTGTMHLALYVSVAIYILTSIIITIINIKHIKVLKTISIFSFLLFTSIAMLLQIKFPNLLLNSMGNAATLTVIFYVLQSPSANIDSLTKVFNKKALAELTYDLFEQSQEFSIFLIPIENLHIINTTVGVKRGDNLLIAFSKFLKSEFSNDQVIRINGNIFAVISTTITRLTIDSLNTIYDKIQSKWSIDNMDLDINFAVIGLNSVDYPDFSKFNTIIQYSLMMLNIKLNFKTLFIDNEYQRSCYDYYNTEIALLNALENDGLEVYFQPIHRSDGRLIGFEALSRIIDPTLGSLNPEVFITISERNGSIITLTNMVVHKVCQFIVEENIVNYGIEHISINLSVLHCMKKNMSDEITAIIDSYNIKHNLISFEITETKAATLLPIVKENMQKLVDNGFTFLLDDFGSGYSNFDYIADLPFSCVKIDKSILWEAMKSQRQMSFLLGFTDVINRLELNSLCEGVETAEHVKLLRSLGVTMHQGYFYSKPLSKDKAIEYIKSNSKEVQS